MLEPSPGSRPLHRWTYRTEKRRELGDRDLVQSVHGVDDLARSASWRMVGEPMNFSTTRSHDMGEWRSLEVGLFRGETHDRL